MYCTCYVLILWQVRTTLIRTWKISRSTWEKFPVTSALYLVRSGCPNYQGMPVSHPPYVITCFLEQFLPFSSRKFSPWRTCLFFFLRNKKICRSTVHRVLTYIEHCVSLSTQILCIIWVFQNKTQNSKVFNSIFLLFSYKLGQTSTRIMVNFKTNVFLEITPLFHFFLLLNKEKMFINIELYAHTKVLPVLDECWYDSV